ncbi:hypothetical protein ACIO3O_07020 [Streptomyces sp. NPDC087440]|uniref:hypothetical protein n=1 Tax=Streptomyces sp. NPDC087440 TaxID=3365790 RepID=UPI003822DF4E
MSPHVHSRAAGTAASAIDFYRRASDAHEEFRIDAPAEGGPKNTVDKVLKGARIHP